MFYRHPTQTQRATFLTRCSLNSWPKLSLNSFLSTLFVLSSRLPQHWHGRLVCSPSVFFWLRIMLLLEHEEESGEEIIVSSSSCIEIIASSSLGLVSAQNFPMTSCNNNDISIPCVSSHVTIYRERRRDLKSCLLKS
jgi:hypothetical protein